MDTAINIIESCLKGNGISSDEIDFIVDYLKSNKLVLQHTYEAINR